MLFVVSSLLVPLLTLNTVYRFIRNVLIHLTFRRPVSRSLCSALSRRFCTLYAAVCGKIFPAVAVYRGSAPPGPCKYVNGRLCKHLLTLLHVKLTYYNILSTKINFFVKLLVNFCGKLLLSNALKNDFIYNNLRSKPVPPRRLHYE